jgi:hypothetical protein
MSAKTNTPRLVLIGVALLFQGETAFGGGCPQPVGQWSFGGALSVASAATAYVGIETGLLTMDVSDQPATILGQAILQTPLSGCAGGIPRLRDGMEAGFRVVDVSDPTAPVEVGFLTTPAGARRVAVVGNHAFVAASESGCAWSCPTSARSMGLYPMQATRRTSRWWVTPSWSQRRPSGGGVSRPSAQSRSGPPSRRTVLTVSRSGFLCLRGYRDGVFAGDKRLESSPPLESVRSG